MKHRIILLLMIVCVLISAGVLINQTVNNISTKPDIIEINKIKVSVENTPSFIDFQLKSKYDFTVISHPDGTILFSTKETATMPLSERINQAIANYDTILDYEVDGSYEGKIIIYSGVILESNYAMRLISIIIPYFFLCILLMIYYFYMRVYLYRPFKKLEHFAMDIAIGNLDLPLPMDKDNLFGAFTESFDIMREELKIARQKVIDEEKSKKELIATLSHDIKTPISIIRVASELLEISEDNEKKLVNIKAIQTKTSEIDILITDLFNSALDDLSELKMEITDIESSQIETLIIKADLLKKVRIDSKIPTCLIKADLLRLNQVFGNIIFNSYKYAATEIIVFYAVIDNFLNISFQDFGNSLEKEDLLLITNRFYRGKNTLNKEGAGLGLYICQRLLMRMGGSIDFKLVNGGLKVNISLALS